MEDAAMMPGEALQTPELSSNELVAADIELDRTIGYASIQNSVPVIRSIQITNRGKRELTDVLSWLS